MAKISRAQDKNVTSGFGPQSGQRYTYESLPTRTSIRVIEWPRELVATTDLRCSLRFIDLDDPDRPEFSALSYTWGGYNGVEADDTEALESLYTNTIVCDDQLLRVTENAHRALCELRWRGRAHLFWVDAVCINQDDVEERNSQVALMGQIYASAVRAMIWLGDDDKAAEDVFNLAVRVVSRKDNDNQLIDVPRMDQEIELQRFFSLDPTEATVKALLSVVVFFARPWFQRLWVVQEAVMAKNLYVICGKHTYDWEALVRLAHMDYPLPLPKGTAIEDTARRGFRGLAQMRLISSMRHEHGLTDMVHKFGSRSSKEKFAATLGIMIAAFSDTLASDSRDRVFAPLAITNRLCHDELEGNNSLGLLVPNYADTVETTFLKAALFILEQSPSLYILSLCRGSRTSLSSEIPTWVPDFRVRSVQRSISSLIPGHATIHWTPYRQLIQDLYRPRLKVKGHFFGRVQRVTGSIYELIKADEILSLLSFTSEAKNNPKISDDTLWEMMHYLITAQYRQIWHGQFHTWLSFKLTTALFKGTATFEDFHAFLLHSYKNVNRSLAEKQIESLDSLRQAMEYLQDHPHIKFGQFLKLQSRSGQDLTCAIRHIIGNAEQDYPSLLGKLAWNQAMTFQSYIIPVIADRMLIEIGNGIIALAPAGTKEGDSVWFLSGAAAPFVLRSDQHDDFFSVVGEAFIPCYMDDEISSAKKEADLHSLYLV